MNSNTYLILSGRTTGHCSPLD